MFYLRENIAHVSRLVHGNLVSLRINYHASSYCNAKYIIECAVHTMLNQDHAKFTLSSQTNRANLVDFSKRTYF